MSERRLALAAVGSRFCRGLDDYSYCRVVDLQKLSLEVVYVIAKLQTCGSCGSKRTRTPIALELVAPLQSQTTKRQSHTLQAVSCVLRTSARAPACAWFKLPLAPHFCSTANLAFSAHGKGTSHTVAFCQSVIVAVTH